MNWTPNLPTEPGDYAWKDSDDPSNPYELVQVELFEPDDVSPYLANSESCDAVSVMGGLWCRLVSAEEAETLLVRALKWIRRLEERKDEIAPAFFRGCDPMPLLKDIEAFLRVMEGRE